MSQKILVPGPKVILMGPPGSGKTDSIRTLVEAGLNVFVVFTEPGMEVLLDTRRGRKAYSCEEGLHWRYHPVGTPNWSDLETIAKLIHTFSYKQLQQQAPIGREQYGAFLQAVGTMGNLRCERCGKSFGPCDQLEPYDKWAIVNDSISSLSLAALYSHVGNKPGIHEGEWGICMGNLERYFNKIAYDIPSMAVLTAHVEPEPDYTGAATSLQISTLGKKLAPKIPRPFSDVLLAVRDGGSFSWSSVDTNATLKTRNFDFSNKIPPTFVPLVQEWHKRIEAEKQRQQPAVAAVPPVKAG